MITQAADRGAGLHRGRGRGRLARRLPRQPLRARAPATTPTPSRRCAASSASPPGCGATPTCSTSSAGCGRTTSTRRRGRSASTASTSTACTLDRRRWSATSSDVDPAGAPRGRASATPASSTSARARPTATPPRCGLDRVLRPRASSTQLVELQREPATVPAPRRHRRRGRAVLRRAERAPRRRRRGVLPLDVRATARVLEPARPPHGRHPRRAARAPRPRTAPRRGSSSGRTTPTSATPARPRWARRGELNLGQLARERHGRDAVLVGFTTYDGTVTAASDWGAPAERKRVRPALPGSYEALFHAGRDARFLLPLRDDGRRREALREPRLERAIGVIYRPETERASHYFEADLADQFDARDPHRPDAGGRAAGADAPAGSAASRPRPTRRRCERGAAR